MNIMIWKWIFHEDGKNTNRLQIDIGIETLNMNNCSSDAYRAKEPER